MAVTMHDVARAASVSIKTVSNVVNDYPHIKPETRKRVLDAIDALGYRVNMSARSLRSGRAGVIGLLIPELRNVYFAELADAVMREAAVHGLKVLIEQFGNTRDAELAVLRAHRRQMVDGVLYSVLSLEQKDVEELVDVDTPMVLLGERIFHSPWDHVTMRNIEGARAATVHLIELGCSRIVALGAHEGEVIGSAGLRLSGYRQALTAAGIDYDDRLVRGAGTWHRQDGADAMRAFLAERIDFDGIVAFNDTLAFGAVRVMEEAGLRVPDDIAVIGFDDIDETRYSLPTLSTIDPGRGEIARTAVQALLERIEHGDAAGPAREFLSEFHLLPRESTSMRPGGVTGARAGLAARRRA